MSRRVWFAVAAAFLVALGIVAFVSYHGEDRSETSAQQLSAWVKDTSLGQELGALHDDGLDLQKVLARHAGTDAVHTVCGVLTVTAEQAHGNLPSTDTQLTLLLDRVYQLDAEAGNDCYDGGDDQREAVGQVGERTGSGPTGGRRGAGSGGGGDR